MHTVWVTRASGAGGAAAVGGAKVGVWRPSKDGTGAAERFASCVTSDDGSCTVETGGKNNNYPELSAFVDAGGCGGRVGAMSREPNAAVVLLHQPYFNPTLHLPAPTPRLPLHVPAGAAGVFLLPQIQTLFVDSSLRHGGALVLDRALVSPGDTLHVTGVHTLAGAWGQSTQPAARPPMAAPL
jgi:hypothetical protein